MGNSVNDKIRSALQQSVDQGVSDARHLAEEIVSYANARTADDRPAQLSSYYQVILAVIPPKEIADALELLIHEASHAEAN